jgi:predicted glycoside hydrolase/deacetylase ChbG (UPF0249 family)
VGRQEGDAAGAMRYSGLAAERQGGCHVSASRRLLVIADDYGVGPATSAGILDLAAAGVVTGTVLLVTSPHAVEDVRTWRRRGMPVRMGWHPCLTMDGPVLPAARVPSLVRPDGQFHELGGFLARLFGGRLVADEVRAELAAQYHRFLELVGRPPVVVNGHKHIHIFPLVGAALREVLARQSPRPFVRRVREPFGSLLRVPGARLKRVFLSSFGRWAARQQEASGYPGGDWLAGVTDPRWVEDPGFFARWLARTPGDVVELMVHPGHRDETLIGRDCAAEDGQVERRVQELRLLSDPGFRSACRAAGFNLVAPEAVGAWRPQGGAHVA